MLELKNVRKTYHTKAGAVNALDGISLTFPTTGLVFISGKSGCGKTTLLNVIGGLDGIDEGEIYIQDKNFSQFSAKEYDSYRNTLVGFIFQEYNLLAEYTVEYNIKIAMELQGVPVDEAALEKLLKDMDIEALRHRKPSELSGGQRQRVSIARALVKQPRIIMADEPTGALDSATGAQVFDTLKKLSKEKLILVVSHDNEFAEKYADRIVYLVDGKIVNDITFTETELSSNVSELDNAVIVREGSDLSPQEKDVLAKAVKERKKIEVTEKVCFRDKQATGKITTEKLSPIAFKKSKMKLKTSAYLGVKSLAVKPIRLIFTILISAFAFALFGLFDAVASFTTETCLHHRLKQTNSTVVTTASYIVDHNSNDKYALKVSDELLDTLSTKTGGKVKGIFDLSDNITGNVLTAQTITEIASSNVVIGKRYYANSINGFIEFDEEKEINENGTFKDFDYTLKLGKYPHLYSSIAVAKKEGHEVAISTYLADSILYHLNGQPLNEKTIEDYNDLLGCTLSIQQTLYKIVGIIDCGKIPSKYDEIKNSTPYNSKLNTLLDSFDAFINSGAQKCFFVAQGFREAIQKETNSATIYYAGTAEQAIILSNTNSREKLAAYVYNSKFYDENNVILFNQDEQNGQIALADDEVLVHCFNLDELLAKELNSLSDPATKRNVLALLSNLENAEKDTAIADFTQALQLLNKTEISPLSATIHMRSKKTGETVSKEVKIVGFYFNVDTNRYASSAQFKLMMNESLMDALSIYSQQGDHSKILFSKQSVRRGANLIVDYLTHDTGLAFTWHCDSVLTVIQDNEPMIRQAADLFLYGALALAVFSIFMLYNYISTSIANKRRSVGVLRALGAGGKDIFLTFLCESLLIGLINGILANALCLAGCTLVNAYIMNTMNISVAFAIFSIRQIPLIAGIGLLTSVISSSLPIIKISKKKPVELIRRS